MSKTIKYPGNSVDVTWDKDLCIHVAECGAAKNELFIMGRDPWCSPDIVELKDVSDVVKRCPSGALSYQSKTEGLDNETPQETNTLHVTNNGPYFLRGDLEFTDTEDTSEGVQFRAALCRCGKSENKPFCDNSHEKAGFRDYGAVGDPGDELEATGGKVKVQAFPDGPLKLDGNLTVTNGSGQKAWSGTTIFLCRCGASDNKPFCDGSHNKIGFKTS